MPEAELARLPDLNPNTVDALNKLRELEPISFLDGTMNITRVHNTGVAFGLGNGTVWSSYLFLAVPVLAIVVLVVLYRKNFFHTAWLKLAYVLLLAGVAGNLTDRLIQGFLIPYEQQHGFFTKLMNGYVVDFIDVTIPPLQLPLARLQCGGHGHLHRRHPGLHRHLAYPGSPGKAQGEKIMTFAWWHVLVALIPILPNLWSIWHIWNHRFSSFQQKAVWLVIAVFLPVLGGLIYIFAGRRHAGEKI